MDAAVYRAMYLAEDRHWWFRGRRAVIRALLARAGVARPARLLDAGCGTGRNLVEFAGGAEAHGVDPSAEAVAACHERGLAGVVQGTVEQLPFGDRSFDLILATDVIEHLEDDVLALRELRRVAAPEGILVCTVPAFMWLWSDEDERLHHRRRYRLPELTQRVAASGFDPQIATYFNSALLPAIAAVRKLRPRARASSEIQQSSGTLSSVLYAPMRAEAELIRRGARLPAGVSIGLVGRANA